ncbi:MAG: hypothetical protein KME01_15345 [Chroococcus sp. CMT-3BRIN-NPC107]|jgi:hypothetical protein|nr:hypothetical protein [Chroococcus sp. CMT-3BRIN-NPC107]
MIDTNYDGVSLDELRRYVLTHREDDRAFHAYIDRSKATGRMISIDLNNPHWEKTLDRQIQKTLAVEDEEDRY